MRARRRLTFFLVSLVACALACSGESESSTTTSGDEQASTTAPADGVGDESATAPSGAEATATDGTDPFGNSVPDDDVDEAACEATVHTPGPTCTANSDCGVCHDGSSCGRASNREEIERLGAQCRLDDAAECEYFAVRCCSGRCRVTGS